MSLAEPEVKVRPSRNSKNLPDAWDDIMTSRRKSWAKNQKERHGKHSRDTVRKLNVSEEVE